MKSDTYAYMSNSATFIFQLNEFFCQIDHVVWATELGRSTERASMSHLRREPLNEKKSYEQASCDVENDVSVLIFFSAAASCDCFDFW